MPGHHRNRSTRTRTETTGTSALTAGRAEDLLEFVRSRDFELIVSAVVWRLVRTPPQEDRGVAEPVALHVVVLHLAHALDADRFPRQVFPRTPAALAAGHARAGML